MFRHSLCVMDAINTDTSCKRQCRSTRATVNARDGYFQGSRGGGSKSFTPSTSYSASSCSCRVSYVAMVMRGNHCAVTLSKSSNDFASVLPCVYSCVCRCLARLTENESDLLEKPGIELLRAALSRNVPSATDRQVLCTCSFLHYLADRLLIARLALLTYPSIAAFRSPWLLSTHIWRALAVRRPAPSRRLQAQCAPVARRVYVSRQQHPSCQYNQDSQQPL